MKIINFITPHFIPENNACTNRVLAYFEYLKKKEDICLIYDFIENIENIKDGLEPFPISLRGINWIKFLTKFEIKDKKIDNSLYAQYYILLDNIEYHLLGNHLLENGFSLLFGYYYFQDEKLYVRAKDILKAELEEQILDDGGHFELSPMYHQIMLFRVLDCINLVENNMYKHQELLEFLIIKAEVMLGWLENISYKNGDIPLLNDSANKISPTSNELFKYAKKLNIQIKNLTFAPKKVPFYADYHERSGILTIFDTCLDKVYWYFSKPLFKGFKKFNTLCQDA